MDPEPGGPKHVDPVDPEHWTSVSNNVGPRVPVIFDSPWKATNLHLSCILMIVSKDLSANQHGYVSYIYYSAFGQSEPKNRFNGISIPSFPVWSGVGCKQSKKAKMQLKNVIGK